MAGPSTCPNANTMVKALMPLIQASGARLCRTRAVVEATTDRKVAPNSTPDTMASSGWVDSTGSSVARPSSALRMASACPPW